MLRTGPVRGSIVSCEHTDLSFDRGYFDAMYASSDDPWGFDRTWYEQRKYDITVAALPRHRYDLAFEPGCANGALTERLVARCDRVVATDFHRGAIERARARLDKFESVSVRCERFPTWWPTGRSDLLVLSEIVYYLTSPGRAVLADALRTELAPGADVIAVHYTERTNYPMAGVEVAAWLDALPQLHRIVSHDDERFQLGVWRRVGRR